MTNQNVSKALARRHLDERLERLRSQNAMARPPKGWLRAIRDALGMTTRQIARRAGVSQPTVTAWEMSEARETITLGKLREAAEALNCELVYALVPRKPLEQQVRDRAAHVADTQLGRTHHTMRLEAQGLRAEDLERERNRLIDELLRGKPSQLWEDQ